jgi:hypothetical protein
LLSLTQFSGVVSISIEYETMMLSSVVLTVSILYGKNILISTLCTIPSAFVYTFLLNPPLRSLRSLRYGISSNVATVCYLGGVNWEVNIIALILSIFIYLASPQTFAYV